MSSIPESFLSQMVSCDWPVSHNTVAAMKRHF